MELLISFKRIEKDKQVRTVVSGVKEKERGDLGYIVI